MTENHAMLPADVTLRAATWGDVEGINRLANELAVADETDELVDLEDHREEFSRVDFTLEEDVLIAETAADGVIGWVEVGVTATPRDGVIKAHVGGGVVPAWRERGIGTALVRHGIRRGHEKASGLHPDARVAIAAWGREEDSSSARLLKSLGFAPARYFHDMRVLLSTWAPVDAAVAPEGVLVRSPLPEDAEAVRLAHNAAFRDHWGSSEQTSERWEQMWGKRVFRPELSRIAVDRATGEVLSYVLSEEWVPGEQYVSLVGTRRDARGRGLASLLLTEALVAARAAGMERAELGVDAVSPTGANGVYERVGFALVRTGVAMEVAPSDR